MTDSEDLNVSFSRNKGGKRRRDDRVGGRREGGRRDGKGGRSQFGPEKTKRLFITIGEKDGAKKRDVLGAICGEAGIPSSSVGNIDMYNKFTFVDVEESAALKVEKRMNGKMIKGRKVNVEISKKKKRRQKITKSSQ